MRFFTTLVLSSLAVLGFAAPQPQTTGTGSSSGDANPFNVPTSGYSLKAGSPTTLTWTPTTSGTVTLQLRSGASSALGSGTVIASSIPNSGTFSYTPPANIVRGSDYTVEIISDSDPSAVNYTPQFVIDSSNTVSSASASGSSTTASASGSSTSASGSSTSASASASASSASTSASASASAASTSSAASSSAAKTSAATTSGSKTAQTTSAPTSGAQPALKVQAGLLALIMGAAVAL